MGLRGQDGQRGYAMAALLVMLGVMAVFMTAALPAWRFQAKREKELELIFRGEQYARAIYLYQRRNGPGTYPPSLDALVQGRFIRRKFKDPMTKDGEFQTFFVGTIPGQQGGAQTPPQPAQTGVNQPGIAGVVSKSKDTSIITYMGRNRYNEWQFNVANIAARMGGPGGRGAPGMAPGGRGQPGFPGGGRGGRGTPGSPNRGGPGGFGPQPDGRGGRGGPGSGIRPPGG